jgi:hypothetical protein
MSFVASLAVTDIQGRRGRAATRGALWGLSASQSLGKFHAVRHFGSSRSVRESTEIDL